MATATDTPLSRADISQLSTALYKLRQTAPQLEVARNAGIDVAELEAAVEFGINRIEQILQHFGPAKG